MLYCFCAFDSHLDFDSAPAVAFEIVVTHNDDDAIHFTRTLEEIQGLRTLLKKQVKTRLPKVVAKTDIVPFFLEVFKFKGIFFQQTNFVTADFYCSGVSNGIENVVCGAGVYKAINSATGGINHWWYLSFAG
jgi:hypothetical protein